MIRINEEIIQIKQPFQRHGWIMTQTWEHLLFLHWAVPPKVLRSLIPQELEIDTYQGMAWLGIIPFLMSGVRLRRLPMIPFTSTFPEINVRTYVKTKQKSGVYFLSLDASNPLITAIAKQWYRLPYFQTSMRFAKQGQSIEFDSSRREKHSPPVQFSGTYEPVGNAFSSDKETIEHWLTERYTLFCQCDHSKRLYYADVYHEPWALQKAIVQLRENTMTKRLSIPLEPQPELAFYARGVQSYVWPITRLD
ncbi:YqjF family protein [Brevibacillus reuszeri]|uniref:YqjF family protein n=1 Tax=Brevibacillus reuszeri TaxID=54915 RepID=UPI00289AB402|nr:DUF2071 domain-containing protein [Brevibacillus reuszeri]